MDLALSSRCGGAASVIRIDVRRLEQGTARAAASAQASGMGAETDAERGVGRRLRPAAPIVRPRIFHPFGAARRPIPARRPVPDRCEESRR